MLFPDERTTNSRIEQARLGSLSAMNSLWAYVRTPLRRRAGARQNTSLDRKEDGSDRVQDCLCKAVCKFGEFKGRSLAEFCNWVFTILDNDIFKARRFWKQVKRDWKREQPLAPDGGVLSELAGSTTSILGRLVREEEREQLSVAAGWCREKDQAVIFRHLFEDQSYDEIAHECGVTCDVVRQGFSRAVRRVGEALRLQALMTQHRIPVLRQEVIGIHRCQGLSANTIGARLELPAWLVSLWLDEARPLIRELDEDKP
jgi:RNA polymerase sigma factor (sigma-70 family)